MDVTILSLSLFVFAVACGITIFASFVKGAVGFAMPMIMISGLASVLPADQALATLLVPTLLANLWQALQGGLRPALGVVATYRRFLIALLVTIALTAQLVAVLSEAAMFLALGVPIVVFAALQLAGWTPQVPPQRRPLADISVGTIAGVSGGLSGVWGPPTVLYLAAINAPKSESIRVQGVVYAAGAVVLVVAHLRSGLLNADTLPLSVAMVPPMIVGMALGQMVQARLDQARFRRAVLAVLIVVGLNLVRKGAAGLF